MTPERWNQIEALYTSYLEQTPAEKTAYLHQACAGDPELLHEIESLLAASEDDVAFLDTSLGGAVPTEALGEGLEGGTQVGPYRLVRTLGHGGMGDVYLAVREEPFHQQVALKVIRPGLATDDLLRRFRTERQILATLNHVNIARLLDGGATKEGRPYLVMEYVEGLPITRYCDEHRLSIKARMSLFQTVCEAVHAAHQNLVVHRDLKPSNILVTPSRVVKLLDFGIAKLLDPATTGHSMALTRSEVRVMTPEYASPEQVRGEAITTNSDVYALGVLLYELLTGRKPYRLSSRDRAEIERVICEEPLEKPSVAVVGSEEVDRAHGTKTTISPDQVSQARNTAIERLQRELSGDLDNITLKAMRKEPERRYASAQALAEDLERHLHGLPVVAQPATLSYRTKKFVGRHRLAVFAVAAFMLLLIGFSLLTLRQSARIQRQAAAVTLERDKSEQVVEYLVSLFEQTNPMSSDRSDLKAVDLLAEGAARVEADLTQQPAVQGKLMEVMGRAFRNLGVYDEAERLTRASLNLRKTHPDVEVPEVIESLSALAHVRRSQGDLQEAETLFREAVVLSRAHLEGSSPLYATSVHNLGSFLSDEGGTQKEGEMLLREALALHRQGGTARALSAAPTLQSLASHLRSQKVFDEAEAYQREALLIYREHYGEDHLRVAASLNGLAMLRYVQRELEEAEQLFQESLAIYERRLGENHPHVAVLQFNIARLMMGRGEAAGAAVLLRHVLRQRREQLGPSHHRVASAALYLGRALTQLGDYEEAESMLRESIDIRVGALGPEDWRTHYARGMLGLCLAHTGRYAEAEALLIAAFPIIEGSQGSDYGATVQVREGLVELYEAWGKPEQAAALMNFDARSR